MATRWVELCPYTSKRSKDIALLVDQEMELMKIFDCDEIGSIKEYVGCKVDYDPKQGKMR